MTRDRVRKTFLLALVISVTVVFLVMLRSFLVTILMAAIFSGKPAGSSRGRAGSGAGSSRHATRVRSR